MLAKLDEVEDASTRERFLHALGSATDPALATRARNLTLQPTVRLNEIWRILKRQVRQIETREASWTWIEDNFDALVTRMTQADTGYLPYLLTSFCNPERVARAETFLQPRLGRMLGGRRNLQSAIESNRQCAALRAAQSASANEFFRALRR